MSASEFNSQIVSGIANEALTKFRFVDVAGSIAGQVKMSHADEGDIPHGIVTETVASAAPAPVAVNGEGFLEVDGSGTAIVVGDMLKPAADSSGKGITSGLLGLQSGWIALEPSAADGDVIRTLFVGGKQTFFTMQTPTLAAASIAVIFGILPIKARLLTVQAIHTVNADGTGTVQLEHLADLAAAGAGTDCLTAALDIEEVALTLYATTGLSSAAGLIAAGRHLRFVLASGAATGLVGFAAMLTFRAV